MNLQADNERWNSSQNESIEMILVSVMKQRVLVCVLVCVCHHKLTITFLILDLADHSVGSSVQLSPKNAGTDVFETMNDTQHRPASSFFFLIPNGVCNEQNIFSFSSLRMQNNTHLHNHSTSECSTACAFAFYEFILKYFFFYFPCDRIIYSYDLRMNKKNCRIKTDSCNRCSSVPFLFSQRKS